MWVRLLVSYSCLPSMCATKQNKQLFSFSLLSSFLSLFTYDFLPVQVKLFICMLHFLILRGKYFDVFNYTYLMHDILSVLKFIH